MTRRRLDLELVRRGLAPSRQQAGHMVESGRVLVDGSVAVKTAALVAPGQAIEISGPPPPFVSRGGEKLAHALDHLSVPVAGRHCLDIGASTGGFTDCLLQRGAASVVAVDSGRGQLHPRIRADHRVRVLERTNARHLPGEHPELLGGADLVVADVSFISLTVLVPVLVDCCAGPGSDLVLLVKPQFEAGRAEVSRGRGVVRDPVARRHAVARVAAALEAHGAPVVGASASPILGPAGNAEFFVHARLGADREGDGRPEATVPGPGRPAHAEPSEPRWTGLVAAAVADAPDAPETSDTPDTPDATATADAGSPVPAGSSSGRRSGPRAGTP